MADSWEHRYLCQGGTYEVECWSCDGDGTFDPFTPCDQCRGRGWVTVECRQCYRHLEDGERPVTQDPLF